jgi:DNA polymerase elongation subunit (family B)
MPFRNENLARLEKERSEVLEQLESRNRKRESELLKAHQEEIERLKQKFGRRSIKNKTPFGVHPSDVGTVRMIQALFFAVMVYSVILYYYRVNL